MSCNGRVDATTAAPRQRLEAGALSIGGGGGTATRFSLVDLQAREVRYLRLSVTDRCNYRCTYCMPADGVVFAGRGALLDFGEIERLVRIFVGLGIRRVRLTGGEPLVRRDIVDLIARIAAIDGVEDLAMTTNAHLLADLAAPLRAAGLRRLNVSLDTVDAARFSEMTRGGQLHHVVAGLTAAREAGFRDTKLNVVVLRGANLDGLDDLLTFAATEGLLPRFIEYMPIGLDAHWGPDQFVSSDEMRTVLATNWRLEADPTSTVPGGGPARYWLAHHRGQPQLPPVQLGFISALSENFCRSCNRVRLSSIGTLRECLSSSGVLSLRDMLRTGETDERIADAVQAALLGKIDGHRFDHGIETAESMSAIGG